MRTPIRWLLTLIMAAGVTVPLTGCNLRLLRVVIPDFETSAVEGVQVWRLDDVTQVPSEAGRLVFGQIADVDGQEVLEYQIEFSDGSEGLQLVSPVVRDTGDPESVRLELHYERVEREGWFKVSSFNEAGSSALSTAQTFL